MPSVPPSATYCGGRDHGLAVPRALTSWTPCALGVIGGDPSVLVVDTSAVLAALAERVPDGALVQRLSEDGDLHAPHLIDIEILQALRGLMRGGKLSADRAEDVRTDIADLVITRYGHEPLADHVWALRDNLTAYDAAFVALSEALGAPLITCDARLAAAPGVVVECYPRG
ncbi:MAG: type II toxin-antitoxin system VapC family toxin [Solirubrobacteraceae bacterium]